MQNFLERIGGFLHRGSVEDELTPEQLQANFANGKRIKLPLADWEEIKREEKSIKQAVLRSGTGTFIVRNTEIYKGEGVLTVYGICNGEIIRLKTDSSEVEPGPGHQFQLELQARQSLEGPVEVFISVNNPVVNRVEKPSAKWVVSFNLPKIG